MNDRYLYKGKIKGNLTGHEELDWAIGNLIVERSTGRHFIIDLSHFDESTKLCDVVIEVDPSTICQCTGFKDKNGKLIWENDICRRILLPTKRIKTNFKIAYVPYKCCLSAIDLDGENVTFLSDYINNQYEVEVIGNVFDNPQLLEVGYEEKTICRYGWNIG